VNLTVSRQEATTGEENQMAQLPVYIGAPCQISVGDAGATPESSLQCHDDANASATFLKKWPMVDCSGVRL